MVIKSIRTLSLSYPRPRHMRVGVTKRSLQSLQQVSPLNGSGLLPNPVNSSPQMQQVLGSFVAIVSLHFAPLRNVVYIATFDKRNRLATERPGNEAVARFIRREAMSLAVPLSGNSRRADENCQIGACAPNVRRPPESGGPRRRYSCLAGIAVPRLGGFLHRSDSARSTRPPDRQPSFLRVRAAVQRLLRLLRPCHCIPIRRSISLNRSEKKNKNMTMIVSSIWSSTQFRARGARHDRARAPCRSLRHSLSSSSWA